MKKRWHVFFLLLALLLICQSVAGAAPRSDELNRISPNIPLDSYVYSYLEKLDGLGYLKEMRTGAKPYTRLQVATWIVGISEKVKSDTSAPVYARNMVEELQSDFAKDISLLSGRSEPYSIDIKSWGFAGAYYEGNTLTYPNTPGYANPIVKAHYQPLNINNYGHRYADNGNIDASILVEGYTGHNFVFSMTPRLSYNEPDGTGGELQAAYVKTKSGNTEFQLGKSEFWWGQGTRSSLVFTNNAESQTALKLATVNPFTPLGFLKGLGPTDFTLTYSILDDDRQDIKDPSLVSVRFDFRPHKNFTFGLAGASIVGGQGNALSGSDYWDFIRGKAETDNANDKWDQIAGIDFRWRLPKANGVQLYGEVYGDHPRNGSGFLPFPAVLAYIGGIYIPRLDKDGTWETNLEYGHTHNAWYNHARYTDGWGYEDNILGDAMGSGADRYYVKFTHFNDNNHTLAANYEHLNQADARTINSYWLTYRGKLSNATWLKLEAGKSYISGLDSGDNALYRVSVSHYY